MFNSRQIKCIPMKLFSDIDEPVLCRDNTVFIQNLNRCSKITILNLGTGKMDSIEMKNTLCFNIHADNTNIAFEFSGCKRGIGIVSTETMELTELVNIGNDIVLGGIWNNRIVFRRGRDIVLFDIDKKKEKVIASCHHVLGAPVVAYGICAWLQAYREKCCAAFYDINTCRSMVLSSPGYINKLFIAEGHLIYQNCCNNKCSIFAYSIATGQLKKVFESYEWVELYRGRDGIIVWTVRKKCDGGYSFDIWIYNIYDSRATKILSDCRDAVIPTVSKETVVWLDAGMNGDNLCFIPNKN